MLHLQLYLEELVKFQVWVSVDSQALISTFFKKILKPIFLDIIFLECMVSIRDKTFTHKLRPFHTKNDTHKDNYNNKYISVCLCYSYFIC